MAGDRQLFRFGGRFNRSTQIFSVLDSACTRSYFFQDFNKFFAHAVPLKMACRQIARRLKSRRSVSLVLDFGFYRLAAFSCCRR